ncbi:MAG: MogA/MoaB family molybdenum cofactor biosynthesis protein [Pseudopedobacter sp.]|nr:MogA/MoaB family molybdenum cofactor biosynthesis protein [Deinococcales bacterium]
MLSIGVLMVSPGGQPLEGMEKVLAVLEEAVVSGGAVLSERRWVPDELAQIRKEIRLLSDQRKLDVVLTLGGVGMRPRDKVPEATTELLERPLPGLAELLRLSGMQKSRQAALSRGVVGLRGSTLIINLGSSETAVLEGYGAISPLFAYIFEDKPNGWV